MGHGSFHEFVCLTTVLAFYLTLFIDYQSTCTKRLLSKNSLFGLAILKMFLFCLYLRESVSHLQSP